MRKKYYWEGRKEMTREWRYGSYILRVRWFADYPFAQVSISDNSLFRFPLIWSTCMSDEQAYGAIKLFENIGYFDMPLEVGV